MAAPFVPGMRFGLADWLRYFQEVAALPLAPAGSIDDAIAQLERLERQSGGFGCFLHMAHNWADWAETRRSYELFARYVTPRFQQLNVNRDAS